MAGERPRPTAAPAVNGHAYPITDHTFDVVVVGAGGAGLRADGRLRRGGPAHRLHHQGVPDALAHGRGAGRHLGLARQHGRGRLALAHVRHREGVGLARRPGRDRVSRAATRRPPSTSSSIGACRSRAPRRGKIYQRPFGGMTTRLRQGHRAAHLRGRRPHRPRHAAHALRPGAAPLDASSSSSISPST